MSETHYRSSNLNRKFLAAARTVSRKVSTIDGVVGILATGGMARGHSDYYSDLDLLVYAEDDKARTIDRYIAVGYLRHKGIALDTPVLRYRSALRHKSPSRYWTQVRRWDLENSLILFDTDGRMEDLRRDKLVFPDSERRKLLKEHAAGVIEHLVYDFELWEKRGWPANLAHTLICGTEHLILWIYAKNKRFQPYTPKWLFYHLENGFVPEARHLSTLRRPFVSSVRNATEARRIQDALVNLAEKLGIRLDFRSLKDLYEQEDRNWHKASEKTRYYLSW
jgi:predicted nucleotidyltransferase